jgi:chromosomal replication initiator protein
MWEFRQKYRHSDVLLVDDIQFISGKKSTQEEFFHTFNTLYEDKKQIVITSDMFPQEIPDIEERLRNRFQWGLIADIQPPDTEHRVAILFSKAEQLGIGLTHDVAEFIANKAKRNIRELEGALHRIAAFAALQGRPIDRQLAVETFQSIQGEPTQQLTIELIQKTVADHFNLKVADLKSKKRLRALTIPRQIAMYLARRHTEGSFPEIGEKFGGKDHTTVMHAVKKIECMAPQDLDLRAHLESLQRQLEQIS